LVDNESCPCARAAEETKSKKEILSNREPKERERGKELIKTT
jgi:hypothetical protein